MKNYELIVKLPGMLALLTITLFFVVHGEKCWGQSQLVLHPQDSAGLVNIQLNNCNNCPLQNLSILDWMHSSYISTREDLTDSLGRERIINLNFINTNLTGTLEIDSFPMLEEFSLYGSQVQEITSHSCPQYLQYLYCNNNCVKSLPPLHQCKYLENIEVINNQLDSIPRLDSCFALTSIRCQQNNLTSLPELNHLKDLWYLDCSWNQLIDFPEIDSLEFLFELYTAHNKLQEFPSTSSFTYLSKVDCSYNQIGYLPNFTNNDYLYYVNFSQNKISDLPDFSNSQNLDALIASGNELTTFPHAQGMDSIRILNLNSNLLNSIVTVPYFQRLSSLELKGNQIEVFRFHTILPNLTSLNISKNFISELPPPAKSPSLNHLRCDSNLLSIAALYDHAWTIPPTDYFYAPQYPISTGFPDSILTYSGDLITLLVNQLGTSTSSFEWVQMNEPSIFSTNPVLAYEALEGENVFQCIISDPSLPKLSCRTIPVRITGTNPITFDPDKNGRRDLYDLIPIALWYLEHGLPRDRITLPEDTSYTLAYDWKRNLVAQNFISINGVTINLKEIDTNGDGVIDFNDFGCIREYYQRLDDSPPLQSEINGDTIGLQAIPIYNLITIDSLGKITIPFRIEITRLPENVDSLQLRGLIFTRGIIEDSLFATVDSIYANLNLSDWAHDSENIIGAQFFFPETTLGYYTGHGSGCDSFPAKKLDVGVMRTDTSRLIRVGDAVIVCVVTEDAKFRTGSGIPHRPIVPILGNISNLTLLVEGQDGNIEVFPGSCVNDTTYVLLDSLIGKTLVAGSVYTHYDSTIDNVLLTSFTNGQSEATYCDSLGQFLLSGIPYGVSMSISASKDTDCSVYKSIDENDLRLLRNAIRNPAGLTIWERLAADVDGNGLIDINDYVLLRNLWNGTVSDYSGNGAWLFIPSDSIPDLSNPFDFSTSRFYSSTQREVGQDFIGILKGDMDFSWVPDCKFEIDSTSRFQAQLTLSAYPNPADNYITFSFANPKGLRAKIEIFDTKGAKVMSHGEDQSSPFLKSGKWQWNLNNKAGDKVAAGIYTAKLSCQDGQTAYKKFVLVP